VFNAISAAASDLALRREAFFTGLVTCVVLLAALLLGDDYAPHTRLDVLAVVWSTTVGLALTHWFATAVTLRLMPDPDTRWAPLETVIAQTAVAVVVSVAATVAVLVLPQDVARLVARMTAAISIAVLVAVESRVGGSSLRRSLNTGLVVMLIGVSVAWAKWLVGR
jgi:hypothetical protein